MDQKDIKILRILSQNARASLKDIANDVDLTSTATKTRIAKLDEAGAIRGYYASIDPESIDYLVCAFVNVSLMASDAEEFLSFVQNCPNVVECYGITGNNFAIMKVLFHSTMELNNFLSIVQKYGETSTNIILNEYKSSHLSGLI